jgi:hypothetical protein
MLPGVRIATRMLRARKGPATEVDRPQRRGTPTRVLPGQLDIYGQVHGVDEPERD